MKKYLILYNPFAGNGTGKQTAQKLETVLGDGEREYKDMTEIGDYSAFLSELSADALVICGGDGTLNRFINDIGDSNIPLPVYFYPSGSGNDFLRDICDKPENGIVPIDKYIKDLPTVTVKGMTKKFINGIGYGIDGYCCEVGDELRKKSDKPVNYAGIAIKGLLFHFKPVNAFVTVDGKEYEFKKVWIAPTMNGRYYGGGMMPTPNQDRLNKDKTLSLMVMHGSGKFKTLAVFPSIFKGEHIKHKEMAEVLEGKEITVRFDRPAPLQIDGETVKDVTECTMKSCLNA